MTGAPFRWTLDELNGALGDTGTLLPLMIGAITVGGLAPTPVLLGFAVAYLATGLIYRLPIPVQPMKAIAALLMVAEVTPEAVALSGVMIGAVLIGLGATGAIDRLARVVPRSIIAGLRVGLGLALGWVALGLMATGPFLAVAALAVLLVARRIGAPSALVLLVLGAAFVPLTSAPGPLPTHSWPPALFGPQSLTVAAGALTDLVLPQLALTTAVVAARAGCWGCAARQQAGAGPAT